MEEAAIDSAKDVLEFIEHLELNKPLLAVDADDSAPRRKDQDDVSD